MPDKPPPSPSTVTGRLPGGELLAKVLLVGAGLALLLYRGLWLPLHNPAVDYEKHWHAARAILAGESPYLGELFLAFNYPLFAGYVYLPVGLLEERAAFVTWSVLMLSQLLAGIVLIAWMLRPRAEELPAAEDASPEGRFRRGIARWWVPAAFLLIAGYEPMHVARIAGNIEPLVYFFLTLALVLLARGKDRAGGVALAAAALVKLAPVFVLIPLVAMRRWKAVGWCAGTLAGYGAALVVTGAWRTELVLYREVIPAIPFHWQHISMSVHRTLAELAAPGVLEVEEHYKRWVFFLNAAMMGGYLGLLALWHRTGGTERRDPLNLLAFGTFMILPFTPLLEVNHFLWVPAAYFLHLLSHARGGLRLGPFVACSVAFACVVMIRVVTWQLGMLTGPLGLPHHFPHTLVLAAMVTASGWCAFSRRGAG